MTSLSRSCHHWVIGDVHSCADALELLVARLPAGDKLVLCGDVINRGPEIRRTMELAWGLVSSGRAIWLMGNHEADLVAALRQGDWTAQRALAGCDTYRQLGDRHCRLWQQRRRVALVSMPNMQMSSRARMGRTRPGRRW